MDPVVIKQTIRFGNIMTDTICCANVRQVYHIYMKNLLRSEHDGMSRHVDAYIRYLYN